MIVCYSLQKSVTVAVHSVINCCVCRQQLPSCTRLIFLYLLKTINQNSVASLPHLKRLGKALNSSVGIYRHTSVKVIIALFPSTLYRHEK